MGQRGASVCPRMLIVLSTSFAEDRFWDWGKMSHFTNSMSGDHLLLPQRVLRLEGLAIHFVAPLDKGLARQLDLRAATIRMQRQGEINDHNRI